MFLIEIIAPEGGAFCRPIGPGSEVVKDSSSDLPCFPVCIT